LFPDSTLLNEAIAIQNRLAEGSRDLFMEMHNNIFRVQQKKVFQPIDSLELMTFEVMSYMSSACRSRQKIEQILREYPKVDNEVEASSFFLKKMEQILGMLERKLIAKSKYYKDPARRHIYMLINRSHIEGMNKSLDLETIFGNDWFQNNNAKIQQNLELYKRTSWNKVLEFLKLDNNDKLALNDNITEEALKENIDLFNSHFERICRVQSTWRIYEKLREEIITSVGNILLPAYGIFIGRLQDILGNQAYKYIKYGMFEIQDLLNHLFLGNKNI
jgi:hypothetical protein